MSKARRRWRINKYGELYVLALVILILIGTTIIATTMTTRTVYATVNGDDVQIETTEYTIEGALEDAGLEYSSADYLSVEPTAFVQDGVEIELINATNFTVTADGETKEYKSLEKTVGAALSDAKIVIGSDDIVEPSEDSELTEGDEIVVKRVTYETVTKEEDVDFKVIKKDDSTLAEGKTKVETEGKKGKDKVTYKVTYIDGKEEERKETARETIEKPVDEVQLVGTAITINGEIYSKKLTVRAYSYTGGGTTASGTRARVGEIAVDPRVIPLGTTVYIPGIGTRRAEDTGGNIKGNTIDIYMSSLSACRNWGVRTITIYIK